MKTVIAGALGECVHVAGVSNFLRLAEQAGWRTIFLGPAVPIETFLEVARREKADLVGVSYRLTPETGERLLAEFAESAADLHEQGVRFAFGGTPPVSRKAEALKGFFNQIFDGSQSREEVLAYLRGENLTSDEMSYPQSTIERILWKQPYPLLRHHFGLPTMATSIEGIRQIAEAKALDVISLGIDQDAQANFFHPERQSPRATGAGGVPVRSAHDYRQLYQASRTGNFPLMRTYSGTDDFIRLAEMYVETINIAWCAIPLFWFNLMDGRGPLTLEESIREHQRVMAWYGNRGIPVELNEPHHWGMRDAPDVVFVTSAYLSAYNARAFGVKDYIAQLMFNSPPNLSDAMDLAKMLAILEMISPLENDNFRIWRQTRTGLLSYPLEDNAARAHLATSIYLQMSLKPHIIHIVGHTEADHAATADDVIAASLAARRSIENALAGQPGMSFDPEIQARKKHLIEQAQITLQAIKNIAGGRVADPLIDPGVLNKAVILGIMDAPQLKNNRFAAGKISTRVLNGSSETINAQGESISEQKRLEKFLN
ncbi:MAG: cobalamin B12-binding domain-containing protein [Anaerolineaceae bacterium]|jgi:methylmalonyl-CoA mutase cobalamin-binding subunit|nr:cobalamin B12-binding domain-containing protein [Anaerolineaceae bacterium]MDD4042609.1 cobalamin B12-binding domain-containing protein [Anaerolineaceae bacterium]